MLVAADICKNPTYKDLPELSPAEGMQVLVWQELTKSGLCAAT